MTPILKNNWERLSLFTFSQDFKSVKSDLDCTKSFIAAIEILLENPVDTGRKLNIHKTFIRRPVFPKVLCTFNLLPVSAGKCSLLPEFSYVSFEF